jgi:hypothetical protein
MRLLLHRNEYRISMNLKSSAYGGGFPSASSYCIRNKFTSSLCRLTYYIALIWRSMGQSLTNVVLLLSNVLIVLDRGYIVFILSRVCVSKRGFGLVIGFIEHLRNWVQVRRALSLIHTLCSSLQHVLSLLSLLCLHQALSGSGFQTRISINFRVQGFMPSLAVAYLTATPELNLLASNCRTLNSTRLHSTYWTQLSWSSDIAPERTQQKTSSPYWCEWRGITCSIAAALSAWCRTAWQHRFPQLYYCCVMSPRIWRFPLLLV